jgi:hypothetical protein
MDKVAETKPKKRGLFALLKESMTKTSEGCGPDCGCHAEAKGAKGSGRTKESQQE